MLRHARSPGERGVQAEAGALPPLREGKIRLDAERTGRKHALAAVRSSSAALLALRPERPRSRVSRPRRHGPLWRQLLADSPSLSSMIRPILNSERRQAAVATDVLLMLGSGQPGDSSK